MDSKKKSIVSLEEVLAYTNPDVVYSFIDGFDVSYEEADIIFNETKKWLWACYYRKKDPRYADVSMSVNESILIIDMMWHTFILFTTPYYDFCHKYFSEFIGHKPTTYRDKQAMQTALQKDRARVIKRERDKRKKLLSYLYDTLGEATIRRWYIEYGSKYTPEAILDIRKK